MKIKDVYINYEIYGNQKGKELVFLHGWGQNIDMMKPLANHLSDNYKIIIIDLPGHGKSEEPLYAWSIFDYQEAIHELLKKLEINKPTLIGHSFGGKISLLYASNYKVNKLIVFGSPFKASKKNKMFKVRMLKRLKRIPVLNRFEQFLKERIGSDDYRKASKIMRDILVKTVNLDITENVQKIKCPTLIIWGEYDEAVPLENAFELEKLISDAGVVILSRGSHYAYLENTLRVANIINKLLEGDNVES